MKKGLWLIIRHRDVFDATILGFAASKKEAENAIQTLPIGEEHIEYTYEIKLVQKVK